MKVIKWLIGSSAIFIVAPIILYFVHFGTFSLSRNFKDWVEFSQYYSVFITLLNFVILALLTWRIHKENIALNKPILIFTISGNELYPHKIKNIGNGPAINIDIYTSQQAEKWNLKIKGLTLGKGEDFLLKIQAQTKLGAVYYDQTGQQSKCRMINTFMTFEKLESELPQRADKEIFIWELR